MTPSGPDIRPFSATPTKIDGLYLIEMKEVTDDRGVVREFYRESAFLDAGLPSLGPWLQVNITESKHGSIRGLHGEDMFKLVAIVAGEAFGAYVDARPDSPSWAAVLPTLHPPPLPTSTCSTAPSTAATLTRHARGCAPTRRCTSTLRTTCGASRATRRCSVRRRTRRRSRAQAASGRTRDPSR